MVTLLAWEKGAEVYRNAGGTGRGDLVLKVGNQLIECDVKQMTWDSKSNDYTYRKPVKPGITPIAVHPVTRKVRWVRGKTPLGLENFWD
jgi:hypothetical protein